MVGKDFTNGEPTSGIIFWAISSRWGQAIKLCWPGVTRGIRHHGCLDGRCSLRTLQAGSMGEEGLKEWVPKELGGKLKGNTESWLEVVEFFWEKRKSL